VQRILIKSVAKSPDHLENADFAAGGEVNAHENLTFDFHFPGFLRVVGLGFKQDFDRNLRRSGIEMLLGSLGFGCSIDVTESALMYGAFGSTAATPAIAGRSDAPEP
jgi:hypothetical protein